MSEVRVSSEVDVDQIAHHVYEILKLVGEDPEREGLLETPSRVAKMYREIFSGLHEEPGVHLSKTFLTKSDGMVIVDNIPFNTVCEHHLVNFSGVAHIGYVPGPVTEPTETPDGFGRHIGYRVAGLSKFARVVDGFARRPQIQEGLTEQIATCINQFLSPQGVIVFVKAAHLCMSSRGVKVHGTTTRTAAVRGIFQTNKDGVKDEFYKALSV